jgi:hypothetical protein
MRTLGFTLDRATLRNVATLAPGSSFAVSFMLPVELAEADVHAVSKTFAMYRQPTLLRATSPADPMACVRRSTPKSSS